jgi:hypothetical protein
MKCVLPLNNYRISTVRISPGCSGEQRIVRFALPFAQPVPHHRDGGRGERHDPFLAAFPGASQVGAGAELEVLTAQPDKFGDPQPSLDVEV